MIKSDDLKSWEEFEEVLQQIKNETEELKKTTVASTTPILFRGQKNAEWELESTLERKVKKEITVDTYFNLMLRVWGSPAIENIEKWSDLERQIKDLDVNNIYSFETQKNCEQIISFMAKLRHHGFPSPLLDWTECSLIAAFFAFTDIPKNAERVAIYTFRGHTGDVRSESLHCESSPTAIEVGCNIPDIERHEKQEANYTLCVQQGNANDFKNAIFVNMEKDINRHGVCADSNGNDVDMGPVENVTNKYAIPVSERNKVLKKLQAKGINRCFLFQDETEDSQLFDYWNIILADGEI
jgi:hypothetical protein